MAGGSFHLPRHSLIPGYQPTPASLGERLRKKRIEEGLSQTTLAQLLGVRRKSLSNWELGRHEPEGVNREKVVVYLSQ